MNSQWRILGPALAVVILAGLFVAYESHLNQSSSTAGTAPPTQSIAKSNATAAPGTSPTATPAPTAAPTPVNLSNITPPSNPDQLVSTLIEAGGDPGLNSDTTTADASKTGATADQQAASSSNLTTQP
ncbi:hypothetical protein KGQ71_05170 [Patescibacteria group bacterium]|nr:hypothetical protein [Patescibacteria group bacterium]